VSGVLTPNGSEAGCVMARQVLRFSPEYRWERELQPGWTSTTREIAPRSQGSPLLK